MQTHRPSPSEQVGSPLGLLQSRYQLTMRKKAHTSDGAFPMSPAAESRASTRSHVSSWGSPRGSSYYNKQLNDDVDRPMCGQATLHKILAVGSPTWSRSNERASLLSVQNQTYEPMPYDVTPMDNIYSADRTKYNQNFQEPQPSDAMMYIPQFNVNKAKQARAKKRLPSVTDASMEETEVLSDHDSEEAKSFSCGVSDKAAQWNGRSPPQSRPRSERKEMSSKDHRIEQMIRSMQVIIMQQEENINRLGSQNDQYRENMAMLQEHVMSLKKEQANQKAELQKLYFERQSFEAEATSLREELTTVRSHLVKTNSERVTSCSTKDSSLSKAGQAPWVKNRDSPHSSQSPSVPPWVKQPESVGKDVPEKHSSPSKQASGNMSKRNSVSFMHGILKEPVQERDDVSSESPWQRSRDRSVFNKDNRTSPVPKSQDELQQASPKEEIRQTCPTSRNSPSGRCSDLQELQARANELRETVAKMKLEMPTKPSDYARYSSQKSPTREDEAHLSSPTRYHQRKRDAVVRYSQGERGSESYWNTHDSSMPDDDGERDKAIEKAMLLQG